MVCRRNQDTHLTSHFICPLFLLFYPWRLKREKWFFRRFLLLWMIQKVTEQIDEKGLFLQSCVRSDDLWRHLSKREKYFAFLSDFTLTWLQQLNSSNATISMCHLDISPSWIFSKVMHERFWFQDYF